MLFCGRQHYPGHAKRQFPLLNQISAIGPGRAAPNRYGFTLIELIVTVAVLLILALIAVPAYLSYLNKARLVVATSDTRTIALHVVDYHLDHAKLPDSLSDVQDGNRLDPWGKTYQYTNLEAKGSTGRTDGPTALNTDFDLYSMGRDGATVSPLTAKKSHDDVIRAGNGSFLVLQ